MERLVYQVVVPLMLMALAALGWWLDRMDSRLYHFQTQYVTHAQLQKTVESLESTIRASLEANAASREADRIMMTQWMTRMETSQQILNEDIKELLRGEHGG